MNPVLRIKLQIWFNKINNLDFYFHDGSPRDTLRKQLIENWDDAKALELSQHLGSDDQFKFT